jgi:UDP-GlcNAc:undecaprenyl-phosphate GlcNAc-1-phosphate transferase
LQTTLVPLTLSVLATALAVHLLTGLSVLDLPNERSLHSSPVPRGGGIGPATAGLAAAAMSPAIGALRPGLLVASAGFALLGMAEDLKGIPVLARLALQGVVGAVALILLLDGSLGFRWQLLLGVTWVVAFVNAFNFMDGINGISALQAIVAGLTWAWVGWISGEAPVTAAGMILVAVALGFLPFNFPRARVFLGDVGSYFFGGWIAAVAVWGALRGIPPEALVAPLALYLVDTGTTLAGRIRRGEPWLRPHRGHVYQRLVALGASHARVDLLVLLVMAGCSALGLVSITGSLPARLAADALAVLLLLWYLATPRLVQRELQGRPG